MGQISGSTEFRYKTKTGIPIEYIYYDLKGSNRYPPVTGSDSEGTHHSNLVQLLFNKCLSEIEATPDHLAFLK